MTTKPEKVSPMMQQWFACKEKAKDAVLFFRLGDFYEAFYEDAKLLSKELDLTLTQRHGIPMSGIPFHTAENYIEKLVAKGYIVSIAEQMEDPKQVKGIVKREIVRTISPATILNASFISEKSNNFFASVTLINSCLGLSLLDFSTGELLVSETEDHKELFDELSRRMPSEILLSEKCYQKYKELFDELKQQFNHSRLIKEEWLFDFKTSIVWLTKHFSVQSLDGFGLRGMVPAIGATGALLSYLQEELDCEITPIKTITPLLFSSFLSIDRATQRHLELLSPLHSSDGKTLLSILDQTQTAMGGRLLKTWIIHPLLSTQKISARQDATQELIQKPEMTLFLRKHLHPIRDLERLIMRIETKYASPRDFFALKISLEHISPIENKLEELSSPLFSVIVNNLTDLSSLTELLNNAIADNPPLRLSDGNIFKRGYNAELEELLDLRDHSQEYLLKYQAHLRSSLDIKTLRVNYNKAFGYFIEVSRGQADKIPSSFERRQTLVNNERFISPELKEFEHKILSAEEKIGKLEYTLFHELREKIAAKADSIRKISSAIAHLDCLFSLSVISRRFQYVRPIIDDSDTLHITDGRHPVIENTQNEHFIPNDTILEDDSRLMLITGPNMAGKSTFIRQVALIVIMAQMGSFVPAKKAHIGLIDKVFSRIGASDDLSKGQSTFMVEMIETANILNNATSKSLVILDEIGRGTSTYDGISIAWAVAEYLLTHPEKRAKTLFATHYYELTELADKIPGAANFNVAVKETDENIVFLRKIVKGSTDKSYGIHVAKLAGIPNEVLEKAREKLRTLEDMHEEKPKRKMPSSPNNQLLLFGNAGKSKYDELGNSIQTLNLNKISPIDALQLLFDWQKKLS